MSTSGRNRLLRLSAGAVVALFLLDVVLASCETIQRVGVPIAVGQAPEAVFSLLTEGEADVVYLTIDDGPSELTDAILELLEEYDAAATFFVHTDHIEDENVLDDLAKGGSNLGNHMPADRDWSAVSEAEFREGFLESHCLLASKGQAYSGWFRPPLGRYNNETMLPVLTEAGAASELPPFLLASYLPWDAGGATETPVWGVNAAMSVRYGRGLARNVQPGEIVVFHDGPRLQRTRGSLLSLKHFLTGLEKRGLRAEALPPRGYDAKMCGS